MNIIPDIAAIVDEEWRGVTPRPSETGFVERVTAVPAEFRPGRNVNPNGDSPRYWVVRIAGCDWGIRPKDPEKQLLLDLFSTHFKVGPYRPL